MKVDCPHVACMCAVTKQKFLKKKIVKNFKIGNFFLNWESHLISIGTGAEFRLRTQKIPAGLIWVLTICFQLAADNTN